MAKVNKSDWVTWKNHPVTEAFIEEMLSKADSVIVSLVSFAGRDPLQDRWNSGQIDALRWLVDWSPDIEDEPEEEEDEDA